MNHLLSTYNRLKNWRHCPIIAIAFILIWAVLGNYFVAQIEPIEDPSDILCINLIKTALWIITLIMLIPYFGRRKWEADAFGFVWDWKVLISLGFIALSTLISFSSYNPRCYFCYKDSELFLNILFPTLEELLIRVVFISYLVEVLEKPKSSIFPTFNALKSSKGRVLLAVLISSIVFTLVHIPIKSDYQIMRIFISSMVTGYVYYYTRSIFFPMYGHAFGATVGSTGFLGGSLVIVIYLLLSLFPVMRKSTFQHPQGEIAVK